MKIVLGMMAASMMVAGGSQMAAFAAPKADRIKISYQVPQDPVHLEIYKLFKQRRALEKLQEFLSPFRLPRALTIALTECGGEADAFYGDDSISICYEYLDGLWQNIPDKTTPAGIAPIDTIVGPLVDTALHEFAHALFDMLKVPVLGRQEDAADQVGAYIYLQFSPAESRRLIMGTVYSYYVEAQKSSIDPSLKRFADEHGLPAQRAYNLLCMAYGADTKAFADFVSSGFLPEKRAEVCEEEYEQIQDAVDALIVPHVDRAMGKRIFARSWFGGMGSWSPRL